MPGRAASPAAEDCEPRRASVRASDRKAQAGPPAKSTQSGTAALRRAGGVVTAVGAPVFPGNLLLVGHRGPCAIMGAPGCARHQALNVVDLVLPRLLIGEKIERDDVAALGLGGFIAR